MHTTGTTRDYAANSLYKSNDTQLQTLYTGDATAAKLIGVPTTSCDDQQYVRRATAAEMAAQERTESEQARIVGITRVTRHSSAHEHTSKRTRFLSVETGQRGIRVTMSEGTRRKS